MTESVWNKYDISRKSPEVPVKRSPEVVYELARLKYFAFLRVATYYYYYYYLFFRPG